VPALSNADKARLAHRVLRLKESGVDSEAKLQQLASAGTRPPENGNQVVQPGPQLARTALVTTDVLDGDAPGPTDPKTVEKLFGMSLTDIWKVWDDCVKKNLQETLPRGEFSALEKIWAADEKRAAEAQAELKAGDFPVHPAFGHNRHLDGAANALYDEGRAGFLTAESDWDTATIKLVLVDSADYSVNLATHKFLSSVPSGARVATSGALASKTSTAGVADAADVTLSAVTGDPSEAIIIVQSSAVGGGADVADTAQRLIGYIDTATGLPVTPNGGDITVQFDSGANRIFKL
jgi:hypothetical protein